MRFHLIGKSWVVSAAGRESFLKGRSKIIEAGRVGLLKCTLDDPLGDERIFLGALARIARDGELLLGVAEVGDTQLIGLVGKMNQAYELCWPDTRNDRFAYAAVSRLSLVLDNSKAGELCREASVPVFERQELDWLASTGITRVVLPETPSVAMLTLQHGNKRTWWPTFGKVAA